jgi:hypothetical protein
MMMIGGEFWVKDTFECRSSEFFGMLQALEALSKITTFYGRSLIMADIEIAQTTSHHQGSRELHVADLSSSLFTECPVLCLWPLPVATYDIRHSSYLP